MVLGAILGAVGLGSSLLGKSKDNRSQQTSTTGFAALPTEVQEAYLKTYLPAVINQFNSQRTEIPLSRAEMPTDIFGSQELWKYQQFKDAQRLRGTMQGANRSAAMPIQQGSKSPAIDRATFEAILLAANPNIGKQPGISDRQNRMLGNAPQKAALDAAWAKLLGGE